MTTLESLSDSDFTAAFDEAIESGDSVRDFHREARRRAAIHHAAHAVSVK